jgi:hypothetical protein
MIRNLSFSSEAVGIGSHGSRILKAIVLNLFLLFVKQLVEIPESLEAFLTAEIAGLKIEFNTSRALKCRGFPAFRVVTSLLTHVNGLSVRIDWVLCCFDLALHLILLSI